MFLLKNIQCFVIKVLLQKIEKKWKYINIFVWSQNVQVLSLLHSKKYILIKRGIEIFKIKMLISLQTFIKIFGLRFFIK